MTITTPTAPSTFTYERWRHGGWYVGEVRYPSGAVGCVTRNFTDKQWRIACDDRPGSYMGGPNDHTYPSRDAAAAAEWQIAEQQHAELEAALPEDLVLAALTWLAENDHIASNYVGRRRSRVAYGLGVKYGHDRFVFGHDAALQGVQAFVADVRAQVPV